MQTMCKAAFMYVDDPDGLNSGRPSLKKLDFR
jgi:hypothetical protein